MGIYVLTLYLSKARAMQNVEGDADGPGRQARQKVTTQPVNYAPRKRSRPKRVHGQRVYISRPRAHNRGIFVSGNIRQ